MHKALYRTYRPETFGDVVGQVAPTRVLRNSIDKEEFTHAYLFSGPRGTGKTSIAKIFAKTVNCTSPVKGEPCGTCDNCSQSTPTDIIEIDAASNNGVDEIREIRENVKYAPTSGRYKVYIIDEVHMLTIAAFNALLKTLEEPPKHVIFVLATTEPHKVPLTIISRCQRYDFKRISIKDIVDRMKTVLEQEKANAEDNALELIARVAQGGMRDALSLLDQAISHSDGTVTMDDVIAITGTVGLDLLTKTIELIHEQKTSGVLDVVNDIIEGGKEPHFFLEDLLTYYRDIILYQTIGEKADLTKAMLDKTFVDLANKIPSATIYSITDVLNEKLKDIRYSNQSKVLLELALVKVCQPTVSIDPALKEQIKRELIQEIGEIPAAATKQEGPKQESEPVVEQPKQEESKVESTPAKEESAEKQPEEAKEEPIEMEEDDNLSILDEVANDLEKTETEQEDTFNFPDEELTPPPADDELAPPEEPNSFFDMVQKDIENGADYIDIMDEEPAKATLEEPKELEENEEPAELNDTDIQEKITEDAQPKIHTILDNSKKELKNEYLGVEEEILAALKKKKMPLFKLFSNVKAVRAVSDTHMVVEYKDSLKAKMVEKKSNQKLLKEVLKDVLGRELTVVAYPTDEILPILKEYAAKK